MTVMKSNLDKFNNMLHVGSALRDCNNPRVHRDLTLSLYFLKAITDIYSYYFNHKNAFISVNPGSRQWLENLKKPDDLDFTDLYKRRKDSGNGERLDLAFRSLAEANSLQLNGICNVISFNTPKLGDESQRDKLLQALLEALDETNMDSWITHPKGLDFPSNGFMFLVRYFAMQYGRKSGDIIPPHEVAQLLAKLLQPKLEEEICDPACFSGSLLFEYKHNDLNLPIFHAYGQEGDPTTWALAKMNLFLRGCDCSNIEQGDTIIDPKLKVGSGKLKQFDVLVSNLLTIPEDWGMEEAKADPLNRFGWGVPQQNKGEFGYIQHMIACMKPETGRMAVIVPKGVLFRGGVEAAIRKKLIEKDLLTAVICLPEKLFYGAIIPVAVLILSVKKKEKNKVLFIDASRDFQPGKSRNLLFESNIDQICRTYHSLECHIGYSQLASAEEIISNDYNLNMPRYVQIAAEDDQIDPEYIRQKRKSLKEELVRLDDEIEQLINF